VNPLPWINPYRGLERSESGAVVVEFSFVLLPLFVLLLFCINVAWAVFARATLQNAVREGVRFAITGQTIAGNGCLGSSVQQVVAQNSFGFVPANQASTYVSVSYYSPTNLAPVTGSGGPAGGNVVQVSVSGVAVSPLAAILSAASPIPLSAVASDVMESPPNGVIPCP
jgi:Flp pilus assembly protein TadG